MTNFWMKNLAIFHDAKKFETYFSCSTLIDIASCVDWSAQYRGATLAQALFIMNQKYFISNIACRVVNQKPLFHLIRSSTEIIEFDHIKFITGISIEDGV